MKLNTRSFNFKAPSLNLLIGVAILASLATFYTIFQDDGIPEGTDMLQYLHFIILPILNFSLVVDVDKFVFIRKKIKELNQVNNDGHLMHKKPRAPIGSYDRLEKGKHSIEIYGDSGPFTAVFRYSLVIQLRTFILLASLACQKFRNWARSMGKLEGHKGTPAETGQDQLCFLI